MDTDTSIKVRDNIMLKKQKANETLHKESFDTLWDKYIDYCKIIKKLAYNSINIKEKMYNKYLKEKIKERLIKTNKNYWAHYIDECNCSDKQKNLMLKELKAFGNWCVEEEYLETNPFHGIPN